MGSSVSTRLEKLEAKANAGRVLGRIFQLVGGNDDEGQAEGFLASRGIIVTKSDLIIRRSIFRPGSRHPELVPMMLDFSINCTTPHERALQELD